MTVAEAFAAIPLAAICCDQTFGKDEARVIREQLLSRSLFEAMEPYAFGLLISRLLKRYRDESWQGLITAAAPALNRHQQETAFALACQLIHCDRKVTAAEREFLEALAAQINLAPEHARQIAEVCEILHRDDLLAAQP
jgi:hypothetical protein